MKTTYSLHLSRKLSKEINFDELHHVVKIKNAKTLAELNEVFKIHYNVSVLRYESVTKGNDVEVKVLVAAKEERLDSLDLLFSHRLRSLDLGSVFGLESKELTKHFANIAREERDLPLDLRKINLGQLYKGLRFKEFKIVYLRNQDGYDVSVKGKTI